MPQQGTKTDGSQRHLARIAPFERITGKNKNRDQALQHVEGQCQNPPLDSQFPGDIGGADIFASPLCNIHLCHQFGDDFSKRYGAQKIGTQGKTDRLSEHKDPPCCCFWDFRSLQYLPALVGFRT